MVHYYGKNLATTRTIVVVMAMAALATAQKMAAVVELWTNSTPTSSAGYLKFEQTAPGGQIKVYGDLSRMQHKKYMLIVHQRGNILEPCISTSSMMSEIHNRVGSPLRFMTIVGGKQYLMPDIITSAPNVLVLDTLNSIMGRAIVLHDLEIHNVDSLRTSGDHHSSYACGIVSNVPVIIERPTSTTTKTIPSTSTTIAPNSASMIARTAPTSASTTPSGICGVITGFLNLFG